MKKIFLILCCFNTALVLCQKAEEFTILDNTKNWANEIIKFPIDWAPDLKVIGFEELLFSPNWKDPKNEQFWSLIISWKIDSESSFSLKEINHNLKNYFDGLMKPNHWSTNFPEPKVTFSKINENKKSFDFKGKMTFFDGFYTGKVITVNILGEQYFCKKENKVILIFRLSPKEYSHKNWRILKKFKLE